MPCFLNNTAIARYPTENLRLIVQLPNEIVDIESLWQRPQLMLRGFGAIIHSLPVVPTASSTPISDCPGIGRFRSITPSVSERPAKFAPHRPDFSPLFRRASWPTLTLNGIHREAYMRDDSAPSDKTTQGPTPCIVLSRWVNEPYPPLTQLLSAHDVARLTRRPRWLLAGLVLIGRFPRKARFRGRAIGWWLPDVLEWIAKDLALDSHQVTSSRRCSRGQPRQTCLALEHAREE
jgi:predicted DNA-binding transcriptional regulator AlpA